MKFDFVAWGAELTPERPALWFNGRWYTYRDLNERATRLANHLAASGIVYGSKVGILSANHLAHFDLLFAAAKLGFIYVPFDPRLPAPELRQLAGAVHPDLLFCDSPLAATAVPCFGCTCITLDEYRGWLAHSSRQNVPVPLLSPESIQMILFTAGSTGKPKAAMISYRQMLANVQGTAMGWGLGPEDCAIQATPCWHAGIHVLSTPLLAIGGRVVLMTRFDAEEYLRLAGHLEATLMFAVPGMYRALVQHADFGNGGLARVRFAIAAGAPCPSSTARRFLDQGVLLRQGWGMTEAGVNCFSIDADEAALHPQSIGRPLPHVRAEIRRPDGEPCAAEETGELTLAGDALCSGYYNRGEEWMDVCRDGWFWTGDLALRDADGRFYIRGRRQDAYVLHGENVYPVEVEAAIADCEGVAECALLKIGDAPGGEAGLAVVVMEPGQVGDAKALRNELGLRLAAAALPSVIRFLPALPRTRAGHVDHAALLGRTDAQAH